MAFRRFILCRHDDVSGISGTGKVAEGVQFSSGKCVIGWLSVTPSVSVFDSVGELTVVHGHDGKTELMWVDEVNEVVIDADGRPRCIASSASSAPPA